MSESQLSTPERTSEASRSRPSDRGLSHTVLHCGNLSFVAALVALSQATNLGLVFAAWALMGVTMVTQRLLHRLETLRRQVYEELTTCFLHER